MSRYIRSICLVSLGFLIIGGFEPYYIRAFSADREAWRRHVAQLPYRKLPGFQALLVETAARTKPGDRIGIWMPAPRWERGYEYAYTRSFYLLAGREPLPLINQNNHLQPENLARADYILCWKCESPFSPGKVVFRHPAGSLSMNR